MSGSPVLPTLLPGFVGTTLPGWLEARLRAGLGGVCLFGPNIEASAQLRSLTAAITAANPAAVIAVDEEGGDVTRLFADLGSPSPGNAVLGRLDDLDLTRAAAVEIGWELRRAGCTVDFAPSVDVNSRADNPVIGTRSFGAEPELVARHGAAWVAGLQSTGVAATAKHFPGHGDTAQDSHLALPVVDRSLDELRRRELVPFAAAVAAGVRLVMTSHLALPQVDTESPATMSRALLHDLLREELGFAGVVVSDALDMAGARSAGGVGTVAVRALRAGCDLLCLGTATTDAELTEIERAVGAATTNGTLEPGRVAAAAGRVATLAAESEAQRLPLPPTVALDLWTTEGLAASFDTSAAARRWLADPPASFTVVRLDADPNIAVGGTPWDPFPELSQDPGRPLGPGPVVVVGRDLHRHAGLRSTVDRLRADRDRVLVVDLGWPSDDRRYADIATFGSSRVVGQALRRLLGRAAAATA